LFFFLGLGKYKNMLKPLNKKEFALLSFIHMGMKFIDVFKISYAKGNRKLREQFAELYGDKYTPFYLKVHLANKLSTVMLCALLVCCLVVYNTLGAISVYKEKIQESPPIALENGTFNRPAFDEKVFAESGGVINISVEALIGEGGKAITRTYDISVPMQSLPDEECVKLAVHYLEENYIDAYYETFNAGISSDLNFSKFVILGCKAELITDKPYVDSTGKLTKKPLDNEPEEVLQNASFVISKGGFEQQTKDFTFMLKPDSSLSAAVKEMDKSVDLINKGKGIDETTVALPQELKKVPITLRLPIASYEDSSLSFLMGSIVILILIAMSLDSDVGNKIKRKRMEIQREFPDFITKFALLMSCGLTAYDAIRRILKEQQEHDAAHSKNPLMVELDTAIREIDLGKGEATAYEDFGLRCRIPLAMKFSSALAQNLRRGSEDFTGLLRAQSKEAWEIRKSDVRAKGEQAATKLIFPMLLSVIAVIAVVLYPAMAQL
jgi:tight adherence protein C